MIPKSYFDELELPLYANKAEIKRAYRKLVKKFHPDKNPSREAQDKFLKIQEAYEILIGDRQAPFVASTSQEPDPEAQRAKEILEKVRRQKIMKEYQEKIEFLKAEKKHRNYRLGFIWNIYRTVMTLSFLVICLIICDLSLEKKLDQYLIKSWMPNEHSFFYGKMLYNLNCEDYRTIKTIEGKELISDGSDIVFIEKTKLMQEPIQVIYKKDFLTRSYPISNSVFSYLHMVGIFLIPIFISWLFRNNVWIFRFLQQASMASAGLFLIYFLFDEMRILRILHFIN